MTIDLSPGRPFPDIELDDHAGNRRRLSELVAGDPVVAAVLPRLVVPEGAGVLPPPVALRTRSRSPTRASCLRQRRPAGGHRRVPRRARRALDVPVRHRPRRAGRARPARDDRHAQRPVRPGGLHALPRPHHPPRVRRLLVLGPADDSRSCGATCARSPRAIRPTGRRRPHDLVLAGAARVAGGRRDRAGPRRTTPTAVRRAGSRHGASARKPTRAARRVDDRHRRPGRRARAGSRSSYRRTACGSRSTTSPSSRRAGACSPSHPRTRCPPCCATRRTSRAPSPSRAARRGTARRRPVRARLPREDPACRRRRPRRGGRPAGPTIERYGSANPWPWDRFDTDAP